MKALRNFKTTDEYTTWQAGELPENWVAYTKDDTTPHFMPHTEPVSYWLKASDGGSVLAAALTSLYNAGVISSSDGITEAERETLQADFIIRNTWENIYNVTDILNSDDLKYVTGDSGYYYNTSYGWNSSEVKTTLSVGQSCDKITYDGSDAYALLAFTKNPIPE